MLKDMPVVTIEQIARFREKALRMELLLIERDGGAHDVDCRSRHAGYEDVCNCLHNEVKKELDL
jgi:hypothetical protein